MLPGPDYIYKCPQCGQLISRGSLMSGNTFGTKFFSDTKRIAPMLPEFPQITICVKCHTIFWINKVEKIGEISWEERHSEEYKDCQEARFLSIDEYVEALNNKSVCNSHDDEFYVRLKLWQTFNDRTREGKPMVENNSEKEQWEKNCRQLITIIDSKTQNGQLLIAELKRNLGEFEESINLLDNINAVELHWVRDQIREACEKKNTFVFELTPYIY